MIDASKDKPKLTYYFAIKIIMAAALFALSAFVPAFTEKAWLAQLVKGAWIFLAPSIVVSIFRYILISIYNTRHAKKLARGNFVLGIGQLMTILNVAFFIVALMVAFGINPKEFITSMTIVAMALAVTFREYITNMISGLLIMFSDQLAIGDRIKVGEHKGRVEDITLSNLVVKNEEDDIVLIPNNYFYTHPLINLSVHRSTFFYVKFELPLAIAAHSATLEKDLNEIFQAHPELENQEPLKLLVQEIGKDFIRFKIELSAISSSDRLHRRLENEVLKQVLLFKSKYI